MTFTGEIAPFCTRKGRALDDLPGKIFHAGYILILDALDQAGRGMRHEDGAAFETRAEQGVLTSVDMVTLPSASMR